MSSPLAHRYRNEGELQVHHATRGSTRPKLHSRGFESMETYLISTVPLWYTVLSCPRSHGGYSGRPAALAPAEHDTMTPLTGVWPLQVPCYTPGHKVTPAQYGMSLVGIKSVTPLSEYLDSASSKCILAN
jgi:hypothetical protein